MQAPSSSFLATLQETIDASSTTEQSGSLLIVDISNFIPLTSLHGHAYVTKLLEDIWNTLPPLLPEGSFLYHTENHECLVILPTISFAELPEEVKKIDTLIQHFSYKYRHPNMHAFAHYGSTSFPEDTKNAKDALENAQAALFYAKQSIYKRHFTLSDTQKPAQQAKQHMTLAYCLQKALIDKQVRLAFQPIIHSKTGKVAYHECLLRLITDEGKIISAGPFIGVAEEMGFIDTIDVLVLEMTAAELAADKNISLSFNLSSLGVENEDWIARAKILFKDPSVASRVIIEITETAIQRDLAKAAFFVATLQDLGCQVALDDFGAGHTSFKQLRMLPVDIIKIDGSFIRDIVDNADNRLFVKTLLDISKGFGLKAVAEFVETGETAKLLMELKVDYMQGNYFCPAVNYRSWTKDS